MNMCERDIDINSIIKLDKPINVKCIDNDFNESSLKIGKIYTIYQESKFTYVISGYGYNKSRFVIVDESIENTINTNEYTYSTLDMIKIILDNPTYHAECINQYNYKFIVNIGEDKRLTYDDGDFIELIANDDRKWKIIKPIIKLSFAEAYKQFKNNNNVEIESCLTGSSWHYDNKLFSDVTDKEIDGDWIVKIVDNR